MGKMKRSSNKCRAARYKAYKDGRRDKMHKLNRMKRWTKRMKEGPRIVADYKKYLNKIGVYVK